MKGNNLLLKPFRRLVLIHTNWLFIFTLTSFIFNYSPAWSKDPLTKADSLFHIGKQRKALEIYLKINRKTPNTFFASRIADTYLSLRAYDQAERYYRLMGDDIFKDKWVLYRYASLLSLNKKDAEASFLFIVCSKM